VSCQELVELITAYLDAALEPAAARALREHLATCHDCDAYVTQLRALIAAAPVAAPVQRPDEQAARAAFRSWRAGIVAPGCGPSSSTS
jgi:anti-sigma factor RsiW